MRVGFAATTAVVMSTALWACGGTTSSGPDAGSGDAGDVACGNAASGAACAACCGSVHAPGLDAFSSALAACICTPNLCTTACSATYCANPLIVPSETDPCYACAVNAEYSAAGNCSDVVLSTCAQAAECKSYVECLDNECQQDH